MNLAAPRGTSIWQTKADSIDATDNWEDHERRYSEWISRIKNLPELPKKILEIQPPHSHDYC